MPHSSPSLTHRRYFLVTLLLSLLAILSAAATVQSQSAPSLPADCTSFDEQGQYVDTANILSAPRNIGADRATIDFNFTDPTGTKRITDKAIWLALPGEPFTEDVVVASSSNTYTITGLTPNTAYRVKVHLSRSSQPNCHISNIRSFTTLNAAPAAPTGLSASGITQSSITLNWEKSAGATGYDVNGGTLSGWTDVGDVATYAFTGLSAATSYNLQVRASNDIGDSPTASLSASTLPNPPAAPTGLSASGITQSSITLNWTKSAGATAYKVRKNASDSWMTLGDVAAHSFTGLSAGTSYNLQVLASNSGGDSSPASLSASTSSTIPGRPAAPSGLSASGITQSSITLNWTKSAGATAYKVRKNASDSWMTLGDVAAHTFTGLSAATSYNLQVLASNSGGDSPAASLSASTLPNPPAAPTGLSASGITQSSITLNWTKSAGATAYKVRKNASDSWMTLGDVAAHSFTGLSAGTSYNLQVLASNSGGDSSPASLSASTSSTIPGRPAAPSGLSASGITQSSITLNWTKSAGATAYKVRKNASDSWMTLGDVAAHTFTGLSAATSYNLQVLASNSGGDSPAASLSASTLPNPPAAPTGLSTSGITQNSITLNWTKSAGATAYKVRKNASDSWMTLGDVAAHSFTGLSAGTSYNLQVLASNSGGDSSPASLSASTSSTIPGRPAAPSGLSASGITQSSITLNWTKSAGATAYKVRKNASDSWMTLGDVAAHTFTGLSAATSYNLQVLASNSGGDSPAASLSASTLPNPPAAPTGLSTSGITQNSITLNWTKSAGATAYKVRKNASDSWMTLGDVAAHSFTGLSAGTSYNLQVLASNSGGDSSPASLSASTSSTIPGRPAAPSGLSASGITQSSITLNWTKSAGATAYKVRKNASDSWMTLGDVAAHTFTGLSAATSYNLQVLASNSGGDSPAASLSASTLPNPPAAPTGLSTSGITQNSITLNWTKSAGATGYDVNGGTLSGWTDVGNVATHTFSGLSANTQYTLQVRAKNSGGNSASVSSNGRTLAQTTNSLASPSNVMVSVITQSSVTVTWTKVGAATAYDVNGGTLSGWTDVGDVATYAFSGLSAGTQYTLQVRAKDSQRMSSPVAVTATTAPSTLQAPSQVRARAVGHNQIDLEWKMPAGATSAEVQGGMMNDWTDVGMVERYSFTGLSENTGYTMMVRAKNSGVVSPTAFISARTFSRGTIGQSPSKADSDSSAYESAGDESLSALPSLKCTDAEKAMIYLDPQPWNLHVQCVGPVGVGDRDLIARGVVLGVDVWGWVRGDFEVCFRQAGEVVFLDAAYAPRILTSVKLYSREGYSTCAQLNRPGTLVLLSSTASPTAASNCKVLLTDALNFRASPGGEILRTLPARIKLSVYSRQGDWVQVDYYGQRGWVSAAYTVAEGDC